MMMGSCPPSHPADLAHHLAGLGSGLSSNKHRYDTVTLIRPNLDQFGSISSNFVQFWRELQAAGLQ